MASKPGKFIISLDFELMWGVRDIATLQTYGDNIRGVHQALPKILEYFKTFNISATFAVVGFLFFENKKDLMSNLPNAQPEYDDNNLTPYGDYMVHSVGDDAESDAYHFASQLVQLIKNTPNQEIGTHTFSHFYCLESGQKILDFEQDLKAAISIAGKAGLTISTIVFPRNQINQAYLDTCAKNGIISYRGNEDSWIYKERSGKKESSVRRFCRLADAYFNISGHHCYSDEYMMKGTMINIPSSRFLRPYSFKLSILDALLWKRIKNSMTHAAEQGLLYHLWWHPHNFGINQDQNFALLDKILQHYKFLNKQHGFKSYNISQYATVLKQPGNSEKTLC